MSEPGAGWSVMAARLAMTLEFLRAELAPTPGRLNATIRVVVASMIVLATSMTLEVPSVALSLFIVLFLTMLVPGVSTQNWGAVAFGGTIALVALTLGIAAAMLIFRFTMDYPPLRLAAMARACLRRKPTYIPGGVVGYAAGKKYGEKHAR